MSSVNNFYLDTTLRKYFIHCSYIYGVIILSKIMLRRILAVEWSFWALLKFCVFSMFSWNQKRLSEERKWIVYCCWHLMKPPYLTDEEDIAPSPWGKSGISYLKLLSTQINLCSDHRHRHQLSTNQRGGLWSRDQLSTNHSSGECHLSMRGSRKREQ